MMARLSWNVVWTINFKKLKCRWVPELYVRNITRLYNLSLDLQSYFNVYNLSKKCKCLKLLKYTGRKNNLTRKLHVAIKSLHYASTIIRRKAHAFENVKYFDLINVLSFNQRNVSVREVTLVRFAVPRRYRERSREVWICLQARRVLWGINPNNRCTVLRRDLYTGRGEYER